MGTKSRGGQKRGVKKYLRENNQGFECEHVKGETLLQQAVKPEEREFKGREEEI